MVKLVDKVAVIFDYWFKLMDGYSYPEEVVIMMLEIRLPGRRFEVTGEGNGFGCCHLSAASDVKTGEPGIDLLREVPPGAPLHREKEITLCDKVAVVLEYWMGVIAPDCYPGEVVIMMLELHFPERRFEIADLVDGEMYYMADAMDVKTGESGYDLILAEQTAGRWPKYS